MDDQLKKLANEAPPPRETAKRQALAAAMRSFEGSFEAKKSTATQGTGAAARLSHIATSIWSSLMKQRLMATSALATLLIVPVAGYVTWQMGQNGLPLDAKNAPVPAKTEIAAAEKKEKQDLSRDFEGDASAGAGGKGNAALDGVVAIQQESERRVDESFAVAPAAPASTVAPAEQAAAAPAEPLTDGSYRAKGRAEAPALLERSLNQALATDAAKPIVAGEQDYGMPMPDVVYPPEAGQDRVEEFKTNPVKAVAEAPVSTFSADVDTASYSMVRRALKQGMLPDADTVRVEELVNYFPYDWKGPDSAETPFKATVTVTPTPWNQATKLLHVAVKGFDVKPATLPKANLVFLIDVSGSMDEPDKLPLLKSSFRLLLEKLQPQDTVSIVTYAGEAGTVLEPTKVAEKGKIVDAMERLAPGGSTAGAAGIEEAYRLAERAFVKDGVNRVMLATDGDFNVGQSSDEELKALIETKRKSGVFLSVFGFGEGNYNDQMMQTIAQNGNGVAAYIDTLSEAEKTLVQEATASLFPIASDVKFQIEFNPATVAEYRQIGFETRALAREDFNNDAVDAGEIGSGHTVTAIYEITPVGSPAILNSNLRYAEKKPATATDASASTEIAFLKMRAKVPGEATSKLTEIPVTAANEIASFDAAPTDVRFSVAVAAFGQKLRGTSQVANYSWDDVEKIAAGARGEDPYGYRGEFLSLVRLAKGLK